MAIFQALTHGIYCIDSGYIQNQYCAIYLLIEGDEVAIIETGTSHTIDRVLSLLDNLRITPEQIKYVIPTHIHLDHVGGASGMMTLFGQARLIIHPRGARHVIDPTKLISGSISVYGESVFNRLYGDIKAIDESRIDIAEDRDSFSLGNRELIFIDTPGHARHHFCIYDAGSNGIFTGDTFGLSYPPIKNRPHGLMPSSSPVHFDADAMLTSIDRLLEFKPDSMYLTHFGQIDHPAEKASDLRQWVFDFVDLCEKIKPVDDASTVALEDALRQMAVDKLGNSVDISTDELLTLLSTDIKLDAQGLAIWWQARSEEYNPA